MPPLGERLMHRVEALSALDSAAEPLAGALRKVIRPGPIEDTLSGTPIGHPVHPAIVAVPIGAWTVTTLLDLLPKSDQRTVGRVQAIGILGALPASASGASDWLSTAGPERRVGAVHAALNYTGLSLHVASWLARRKGRTASARLLAMSGTGIVGMSGWIGGHLAYALGIGVDTTVFESLPDDWTDAIAESDVPATGVVSADVGGVPILFARHAGSIVAYANRCTHRGGPLDEGEVRDGCVVCPWHGSAFDLADGSIASGPATRPQPKLAVEVRGGRVHIRRQEERTLRTNPVGA